MKYYEKMLELGCFNKSKVIELTGSEAAAKSLLYDYQQKRIYRKRNLYIAISLEEAACPSICRIKILSSGDKCLYLAVMLYIPY